MPPKFPTSQPVLWQFLFPVVHFYRGLGITWIASIVLSSVMALCLPAAVREVVNHNANASTMMLLAMVVIGLAVTTAVRYFSANWFAESVTSRIRQQTFDHLLTLDVGIYQYSQPGDLLSRLIADTDLIRTGISQSGTGFLRNVLTGAGATIMLFATSPKLGAIAMIAVPIVVLPIALTSRRLKQYSRDHQDRHAQLQALASEVLGAVPTVQTMAREPWESQRFLQARTEALGTAKRRIKTQALQASAVIGGVGLAIVLVVSIGANAVQSGQITGGQLGQFLLYAFIAGFSAAAMAEVIGEVQRTRGGLERVLSLVAMVPAVVSPKTDVLHTAVFPGGITFDNVSFRYPGREGPSALQGVSFQIRPGQTVAIVGPSGAGKSTLLQLLLRFYDPCAGSVIVDGADIRTLQLTHLRDLMAVVPQHPVLFSTTVIDNIRYGKLSATDDEIKRAANDSESAEFIARLPHAYDTCIGVRGATLSGGQQQRLAIARALVRNAPILLLDEATSALDAHSEQALQRAFERSRKNRTTIVIAHRLATVKQADLIIVLDKGSIVAQGTHTELIAQKGLYAELAKLQFLTETTSHNRVAA